MNNIAESITRRQGSRLPYWLINPRGRWWLLGLLLALSGPAGEARAQTGPGRIAVAGVFPTGYVGLLARYGLPKDILLDYQLADPEILSRYDLVIVAGLPPEIMRGALPAFERLLDGGGSILLDYSSQAGQLLYWLAMRQGNRLQWRTPIPTKAPFRLVGDKNPLRAAVGDEVDFPSPRAGFIPTFANPENVEILAEYVTPAPRRRRPADPAPPSDNSPAIALQHYGKGKVLLCGPALGQAISLAGIDYDRLILGMIRLLTDGRATPQLEPEGPRLGRKESSRSLHLQAEATPEETAPGSTPVPERQAGPGASGRLPAGYTLVEGEPTTEFNLDGQVAGSGGEILLNYWNSAHTLRVRVTPTALRITRMVGGRERSLAAASARPGAGARFVLKERSDRLIVMAGPAVASADLTGVCRGSLGARGTLGELRYQPVEPAYFSDDFMRTSDEDGGWEPSGGEWKTAPVQNPNMGANPFSCRVDAAEAASALNGYPFWDEYRFSAAARPEAAGGSIGLGMYAQDAANMLLFQTRIREGAAPLEDGFTLVRLVGGKPQVLARCAGGLTAGEWYRLQIRAQGPWIGAFVDGVKVLTARDTTFTGGRIVLHAEKAAARFDDVLVEPANAPAGAGQRLVGYVPTFAGVIDVDSWAGPATPWDADPKAAGLFWRRGIFFGDVGLRFALPPLPPDGQAMLLLDGDGQNPDTGFSVLLQRGAAATKLVLRHAGKILSQAAVSADKEITLGLRRQGNRVIGLIDEHPLVTAPYVPAAGGSRLAFRAVGFSPRVSALAVWSDNLRDYTFDAAPVDWWVGSGDWDVTNRWSCTPDWSWFGGYSDDVAAIWHKKPLTGDTVLDFYAGPKMIALGGRGQKEAMADFNALLCGDGRDVDSGYAFVVGENGVGASIRRRGQVVAQDRTFRLFSRGHNRWANVRVEKHGARVQLFVEGQPLLQYDDPEPLPGGYAGVWTRRNGIMLPRITLYFEKESNPLLSLR